LATGWLRAVTDKRIAASLQLMHGEPGRNWHLDELARASAMSRATFAMYFKTVAGVAPMTYLTQWRMRLAEQALRENRVQIGDVGRPLGYTSESAFTPLSECRGALPYISRAALRRASPQLRERQTPETSRSLPVQW
jgi:AraC-like DNA-binding protein